MKLKEHLREVERGNVFKLDRPSLLSLLSDFGALKYNTILLFIFYVQYSDTGLRHNKFANSKKLGIKTVANVVLV